MRENYAGLSVSAIVHILVVAAFFVLPVEKHIKPKSMLIDFSIEKDTGTGSGGDHAAGVNKKGGTGKAQGVPDAGTDDTRPREAAPSAISYNAAPGQYSDPQAEIVVHGTIGTGGTAEGTQGSHSSGKGIQGNAGGGQGRTLDYGRGGQAERNFAFIRENIMRNITYPERARRMGWEGKVLLSFVVSESGTIEGLKIVNSSGFRTLDENAREAVLKTRFSQRIPYRMAVVLPVEYRLE